MDSKSVGITISELRKKRGLTQLKLAEKLNVTDKTVSKWENGQGYPEITQFPALAKIFGVSVDYLMTGENNGITIAGNIIADVVKNIDCYPKMGMLSNISSVSRAVGGCAPNTAVDISKIDKSIPIEVIGRVGDDDYGRYIVSNLHKFGILTDKISVSATEPTSFSDVMSLKTGERTFFHARGANAEFSPRHIDVNSLNCNMFHIGYILLLDEFDKKDKEYGTVMARFLCAVQERGIKTSIDVVSNSSADYKKTIVPALKYCNYVIINEIECCAVWGTEPYAGNGKLNIDAVKEAMTKMAEYGVKDRVIIHSKELGLCLNVVTGEFTAVPSLKIPKEEIKGSVGAGDAYCAGCLYGLYNGMSDKELLEFASAAAACNLFSENSIDGMLAKNEILKLPKKYGRLSL